MCEGGMWAAEGTRQGPGGQLGPGECCLPAANALEQEDLIV